MTARSELRVRDEQPRVLFWRQLKRLSSVVRIYVYVYTSCGTIVQSDGPTTIAFSSNYIALINVNN